jgi:hypothetical protein
MNSDCSICKSKGVFRKRGEIVTRKIAGEVILVPITGKLADMQRIFSLNPVGEFIWEHFDGEKDLGKISNDIQTTFDVKKDEADADIQEFVSELLRENLITSVD